MLVTEDGEMTGAISGGCLAGDALRKGMAALVMRQSKLVIYDSSNEDDVAIGMQLGCEGIIRILFEPLDPEDPDNPVELLRSAISYRQESVLVTLFFLEDKRNVQPGTCLLLEGNGGVSGMLPHPEMEQPVMEDARQALADQATAFTEYHTGNGVVTVFLEYLQPAISLVVVGAGNDAIPLTQIATALGWDIRVIDGRSSYASPQRFLNACQVVVSKPEKALEQIPFDDRTAFVMMTHNYNYDLAMLRELLLRNASYVGMLGPKRKLNRMLDELCREGIEPTERQRKMVFGPVGLDIGAETAEEIALSIAAEIQAVFSGKPGMSLREKPDRIHADSHSFKEERVECG
jgi:xanthine/CO dehydrogenase XdhC/CoxF family maturation factor